jgi:hypothetical protein
VVMVAIVVVAVVAALWRPTRLGAALAIGVAVPLVAQAISAIIQVQTPATPAQFGVSQAEATALGLKISSGLTAMFWVYCAFVATMLLLTVWMLLASDAAHQTRSTPAQYWQAPAWGAPAAAGPSDRTVAEASQPGGLAYPSHRTDVAGGPGQASVVTGAQP